MPWTAEYNNERTLGKYCYVKHLCRRSSRASSSRTIENWIGLNRHPNQLR